MAFTIRPEEPKDIEQVREIVRAAFPTEAESQLVDALRANGKAVISLVAVSAEDVLGHILFSPVSTTPPREANCVVLGNPNYYQLFGFEKASKFGMRNEYGVDEEFMVIRFTDRSAVGMVKYALEFAMFSV